MKRTFLVAILLLPLTASADCTVRRAEPFNSFSESFKDNNSVADSRTQYPLISIRYEDDGVKDHAIPVESTLERSVNKDEPSLAAYALQNELQLKTVSLKKSAAVVRMDHPGGSDALVFEYHFVRKGRCWYLHKLEDHSIS
jgi:hypothetical protein